MYELLSVEVNENNCEPKGRFTLILGYELCSMMKIYCNCELYTSIISVIPLL
jgi:hypothetical protein